jgi:hypothetical protein
MGSTTFGALYKAAKEDGAFDDVLPEGDFHITLVKANSKETKKGDASIGVQAKVTGGVDKDDPVFGKTTWVNLNFSEKAAPISFRQLKSWGFSDDFLEQSESADQIAEAIPGIVLDATVKQRSWGANDENVSNDLKVHAVLTPPATGAAVTQSPSDATAAGGDGPEGY